MAELASSRVLSVLLPRPLRGPLEYLAPRGMQEELNPGDYVRVPLRGKEEAGVVWGRGSGKIPASRLRAIQGRYDLPGMPEEMRTFLDRASRYTMTSPGAMLALAFRSKWMRESPRTLQVVSRSGPLPARMTPARKSVLETLESRDSEAMSPTELAARAGVSRSVIIALEKAGTLSIEVVAGELPRSPLGPDRASVILTDQQARAAGTLSEAVRNAKFQAFLLQGVTGSGKTEVYLDAVETGLNAGKQVLILLPEIALTEAIVRRLAHRLGTEPAVWHSRLGIAARGRLWRAVARGEVGIVAGARSALFLPFCNLGLVVVDEEHDSSYKQEDGVIYNARDLAVLRASLGRFPAVLATATVSLESHVNACRGRYLRLSLPKRFGDAALPEIGAVDLRVFRPGSSKWISPPLVDAARETLAEGRQSLLFLNRRGYAPLTICRACGHRLGCSECDTWLVTHHRRSRLSCHLCGYESPLPEACPECGETGSLTACGPGVERIAEEIAELFPEARSVVLSSDTVRSGEVLRAELRAVAEGEVDIVIGTQIVAKGHHFPGIALVGVVDTDLCLRGGDLRAGEKTFQIVRQVTGRAGRGGGASRALLQTVDPENPILQSIIEGDEMKFLDQLADDRRSVGAPPFGRYVAAIISGKDASQVRSMASALASKGEILSRAGIRLYGPVAAPFARIRGRWRWRLLAAAPRKVAMQRHLAAWRDSVRPSKGVKVALDVDPQSFL